MKKTVLILMGALLIMALSYAQDRTIGGNVTSREDGSPLPGVLVALKGTTRSVVTNAQGAYSIVVPAAGGKLQFSFVGLRTQEIAIGQSNVLHVAMEVDVTELSEVIIMGYGVQEEKKSVASALKKSKYGIASKTSDSAGDFYQPSPMNTEEYDGVEENIFHNPLDKPLSTFSIDVDAASYANVRRFINNGQRPPIDAVRIEELINYFDYDYPQPKGEDPFSITLESASAPWNKKHQLVHIGLQGKVIPTDHLPPSNLVFLIDVSGSMDEPNKLPLLKASFKMLVQQLRREDKVAVVVYAGAAGVVLPSTSGSEKKTILDALDNLQAGGSTAGGEGIRLAYELARNSFQPNGNNRVILATDGDFNVGESSNAAMERLVEEKRKEGVFLTVLGFGMGNYKDSKMEILADKGNGNYAYIDSILEAQKVLVNEFGGTLFTIAKDVKLQVEFNPARVKAYRLIGYENRALRDEDFNNDQKDAGELGSGHSVTALYEIIPVGADDDLIKVDPLKYQQKRTLTSVTTTDEILTVKFRYKDPSGTKSKLLERTLTGQQKSLTETSDNFRWSAAVAGFGMLLRESPFCADLTWEEVEKMAEGSRGADRAGYRLEFINLLKAVEVTASRK